MKQGNAKDKNTISCPGCGEEISIGDALFHEIEESVRDQYSKKMKAKEIALEKDAEAVAKATRDLEEKQKKMDQVVAEKLTAGRDRIFADAVKQVEKKKADELMALKEELEESEKKVQQARDAEREIRKTARELEDMRESLGVSLEDFRKFRNAVLAFCDVHSRVALILQREILAAGPDNVPEVIEELWEFITCFLKSNFVYGSIMGLSGISSKSFDKLISFFSINGKQLESYGKKFSEGYFPPFVEIQECALFSPYQTTTTISFRNIVYALNRLDPDGFSKNMSSYLEPCLMDQVATVFGEFADLEIRKSVNYSEGEFDLLVYQTTENSCLHLQIKAPVNPQGARMVERVETRAQEGIAQLRKFATLEQDKKDAILSKALGKDLRGVVVFDVLVMRSAVGTSKVWSMLKEEVAINLALLVGHVDRLKCDGSKFSVSNFKTEISALLEEIRAKASPKWEMETIKLMGKPLAIPLLRLDVDAVGRARKSIWSSSTAIKLLQ